MDDRRIILHVDLNSFFATAEQQANPYLRGKPVGIIKAHGRTCVIAASVEAKRYGVKTGSDVFEAKKLCPLIILVPADFDKYADITYRFINICQHYSPLCEVFSLDECFIDVTESEKFFGGTMAIASNIKRRLREEIGERMMCSVGISYNRLLAKLASSQIKPDGLFAITPQNTLETLDKSELMDVCGIGWALDNRLLALGIDNFPKLRACPEAFLAKHFGPYWWRHLYNICRGIDHSPVVPFAQVDEAKSVSRTYTTHRPLTKRDEILKLIRNLCEETAAKARRMGLAGRYVGVSLRGQDEAIFEKNSGWMASKNYRESWYGHKTLKNYIDDGKQLFDLCLSIAESWPFFKNGYYARFCGVTLAMLTQKAYQSIPLFFQDRRRQDLISTIDLLNQRFGDYTIFPGQLLGTSIVRPEVNGYFGDKSYRLKFSTF